MLQTLRISNALFRLKVSNLKVCDDALCHLLELGLDGPASYCEQRNGDELPVVHPARLSKS